MSFQLEDENALKDALQCCSKDVTQGEPIHQRYGRGLIMGVRAAFAAMGYYLALPDEIIRRLLPEDVDPACYPHRFIRSGSTRFRVHEHFNGFSVEDTETGQSHWLSDGVDCVAITDDEYLSPGAPDFCALWADDFNGNEGETLEAYFPSQAKLEAEGKVKCCKCGIILDKEDAKHIINPEGKPEDWCPTCVEKAQ